MAQRIIAIGGQPASGKSTLMKRIIKEILPLQTFSYGLVKGLYSKVLETYIIGVYDNSVFCGTDKLSMAVQPDFVKLLNIKKNATFVFEGDRLFNQSLFDKKSCEIYILEVSDDTLRIRHEKRQDNQSHKFKKAKRTKIENIKSKNKHTILRNDTEQETIRNLEYLLNKIQHGV